MKVRPWSGDADAWDRFVRADPAGSYCHLHGWRAVLADGLGHEVELLAAYGDAGAPAGLLPVTRVGGPLGSFLVSAPFLSCGGPIGSPRAVAALAEHAVERARAARVDLLELRCRRRTWAPDGDRPAPAGMVVSDRRVTVVLALPSDPDELWRAFRSKVRSQVRRPLKEGMEARFGAGQLDAFYAVFARNMRDLGTPVLPRRFFAAILEAFPDLARVGVVYHEGEPAAGGFGFRWRDELEMTWASALQSLSRLAPNMLLYWAFMKHAVESGAKTFNFGRCPPGTGTHRFKLQWGGRDEALPWLQWSRDGRAGTPSPAGGRFALATAIWRRLPVSVATRVGPWIARTIP